MTYQKIEAKKIGMIWLCDSCGSVVLNRLSHDKWHNEIEATAGIITPKSYVVPDSSLIEKNY